MSHVVTCSEGNGTGPTEATTGETPSESVTEDPSEPAPEGSTETSLEGHIERLVEDQLSEVRAEVERLSADVEEIENFATISLGERRLDQNEANLAEFSASLTEFSEQTLEKVNDLESRLELQTIVLVSILESLADADVEVDVSEIRDYQQEQLVTEQSASGNLEAAIDAVES